MVLGLVSNWLAAGLLAFTIVFYAVIYSMWLKRSTPQNIVIGGAAGALPPVVAQAAVSGAVGCESVILFAIIFIWTPPHFWALALVKSGDYARAGIPMMPNVAGPGRHAPPDPRLHAAARAPRPRAGRSWASAASPMPSSPTLGGLGMLALALQVYRLPRGRAGRAGSAQQLFGFSILYLFLLFATLLAEHGLGFFRPVLGCMADEPIRHGRPATPRPRRPRSRSAAASARSRIALTLGGLVLLFYVVTIAKLGPRVLNRPL